MPNAELILRDTLRKHRLSFTAPRQVVFTALRQADTLSMHELVKACAPAIDRSTVYRTVSLFEELGIVQRLQIGWRYKLELSDRFHDHHHHATCDKCGAIIPLAEDKELENRLARLVAVHDFEQLSHQIEIRGICASCRQR